MQVSTHLLQYILCEAKDTSLIQHLCILQSSHHLAIWWSMYGKIECGLVHDDQNSERISSESNQPCRINMVQWICTNTGPMQDTSSWMATWPCMIDLLDLTIFGIWRIVIKERCEQDFQLWEWCIINSVAVIIAWLFCDKYKHSQGEAIGSRSASLGIRQSLSCHKCIGNPCLYVSSSSLESLAAIIIMINRNIASSINDMVSVICVM